jgi:membrane protein implicated in regulation of membrane protease activity
MLQENAWILMTIGVVLCVAEIFLPGFIIFPIGVGALMAGGVAYFGAPTTWVLITWSITSIVFWLSARTFYKRLTPQEYKTGIEALVGKEGKVIEEINGEKGRVKIYGDEWEIINENNMTISVGEKVKIIGFEGNKLKVSFDK